MTVGDSRLGVVAWRAPEWTCLAALVLLGAALRAAFFTGFFGTDEVIYTEAAYGIVTGEWPRSTYIGALRYGINIPVAMFMMAFGTNEIAANLWSFVTSIGEVALVYALGNMLWGLRAGFLAGLVIALLPLHIHYAGRLMADAPLTFFMTLSVVLFLRGQRSEKNAWFLAAGLAAGAVFWIKQPVIVYLAIFGIFALVSRRWETRWLWMVVGVSIMFAINLLLIWVVTGDVWHLSKVARAGVDRFVEGGTEITSPVYYLRYLFLDIRHTWLLAFLALAGAFLLVRKGRRAGHLETADVFVLAWTVGVITLFSLMIVSLNPVKLIFKQTNYMLMFAAPLALLAGFALAQWRGAMLAITLAILAVGSVTLAALEQQAITVFTANSKAAVRFAQEHPDTVVFGTANAGNAAYYFDTLFERKLRAGHDIVRPFAEIAGEAKRNADGSAQRRVAIVDQQTLRSGNNAIKSLDDVPACFRKVGVLVPVREGAGLWFSSALEHAASAIVPLGRQVGNALDAVTVPRPAVIFEVPPGCSLSL